MSLTDEELAERARRGSQEAFAELVANHQRRTYGLALHMLHDPDEAADVAQETFLRCYASLDAYDCRRSFGAWLYRIAYNHCLDVLRKRRHRPTIVSPAREDAPTVEDAPDPGPGVEELVGRIESLENLRAALDGLSEDHRHILALRYTLDLSYQEMAHVLDIPESTVTMRLHHARRALRAHFKDGAEDQPDAAS